MTDIAKIVQELVSRHGAEFVRELTAKAGFSAEQAGKFVPAAGERVASAISGGGLDLSKLLGGDFAALLSRIDVAALAKQVGIDGGKAQSGLAALLPLLLQLVKQDGGGLEGLLKGLGGGAGLGDIGKMAGKLFGKD